MNIILCFKVDTVLVICAVQIEIFCLVNIKLRRVYCLRLIFVVNADLLFKPSPSLCKCCCEGCRIRCCRVAPSTGCGHKIEALGFQYRSLSNVGKRSGFIPLLTNLIELVLVYRSLKPDIIHNSSIVMCSWNYGLFVVRVPP